MSQTPDPDSEPKAGDGSDRAHLACILAPILNLDHAVGWCQVHLEDPQGGGPKAHVPWGRILLGLALVPAQVYLLPKQYHIAQPELAIALVLLAVVAAIWAVVHFKARFEAQFHQDFLVVLTDTHLHLIAHTQPNEPPPEHPHWFANLRDLELIEVNGRSAWSLLGGKGWLSPWGVPLCWGQLASRPLRPTPLWATLQRQPGQLWKEAGARALAARAGEAHAGPPLALRAELGLDQGS